MLTLEKFENIVLLLLLVLVLLEYAPAAIIISRTKSVMKTTPVT